MHTTLKSDATPAYRGYRLQTLYTLSRILTDDTHAIFRPEGKEDLEILDHNENTVEIVQVKAHTGPLTLSDFSSEKEDSFFYRVAKELKEQPHIQISIVSFGRFGSELELALNGDERKQQSIAKKLAGYGFLSESEARHLISKIQPVIVEEASAREHIYAMLQENSITGGDHDAAFDLLMFWLYQCAESKANITHQNVIEKFINIGKFINVRHTYHQEWFTTIQPIETRKIDEQEYEDLSRGFYQGVSAQYEHILANLDVERSQKMQEIVEKFKENKVVIMHAASGQGKTTLAYRYLHEYVPQMGRFKIEVVEDRRHALNIATVLAGHAKTLDIPLVVSCDVSAKDRDWTELVKQLSRHQNIVVLVTIREEDFKRANISGAEIQFSEVELTLENGEAEHIYHALTTKQISAEFLSFEEAWNRFGGEGPLMEFVYLVTQGDTLQARLKQQIIRIEDEIDAGERPPAILDLLRLVSVAAAYEAKVKLKPLVKSLNLPVFRRALELLEKEYALLKLSNNESCVEGLHPIRSAIVAEILTIFPYPSWSESATNCLSLIDEADLEIFLLYAFLRHEEEQEALISRLMSFHPEQWVGIAGIVRALIWLGVSDYVEENHVLIQEIVNVAGDSWYGALDFDIANAVPGVANEILAGFGKWGSTTAAKNIQALQTRQTDKQHVFSLVKKWLVQPKRSPISPTNDADWSGMAETMFWVGRLNVDVAVADWIDEAELDKVVDSLSLGIVADLMLGLSYGYAVKFPFWLERNRLKLMNRFRQETETIVLEDDGQTLSTHFLVSIEQEKEPQAVDASESQTESNRFHEEAMQRIRLLRKLFPNREAYASQGYGHRIWSQEMPVDSTQKPGVLPSYLPPLWLTAINSTFRGLVNQSFRPQDWLEYARLALEFRKTVLTAILGKLEHSLDLYLRKQKSVQFIGNLIDARQWEQHKIWVNKSPMLPRCVVDEWGFTDEFGEPKKLKESPSAITIQKYKPFLDAFRKYTSTLFHFIDQSLHVMIVNPQLKRSRNTEKDKQKVIAALAAHGIQDHARRSTMNFADVVRVLPKFQKEFRQLLEHILEPTQLDKLERREQQLFNQVWALWYFFAVHPNQVLQNPQQDSLKRLENAIQEVRKHLRRELKRLSSDTLQIQIASEKILWEDTPALWLTIDGINPVEVYSSVEHVVKAVQKAVHTVEEPVLQQSFLPFHWSSIAIVPLIRGKSLNAEAWHININILTVGEKEEELRWWNLIRQPIPQQAFAESGFEIWNIPRLETGARLSQSVTALSLLVAHIRDLDRIPDADEQGVKQLHEYLQQVQAQITQAYQEIFDSVTAIASVCNELTPSDYENRPNFVAVMQGLSELRGIFFDFKTEFSLNTQELVEWAPQLEKARNTAFAIYLFWVADVLDELNV